MSAIFADGSQCVFPKAGDSSVRECVAVECFISFFQWNDRVFTIGLFHPLHHIQRIIENLLASLYKFTVFAFFEIRIVGILFVKSVIIINEIDRSERTVFPYFAYYTANAVSIIRVVFLIQSNSVITHRYQTTGFRDIKAHALVHDGNQVFSLHTRTGFFGISIRYLIRWKYNFGICPLITVF